jgi:cysteine desulfurase / selenocysteine lyase
MYPFFNISQIRADFPLLTRQINGKPLVYLDIVFVRGATEAINLVAQSYGRTFLQPKDRILITELEHHSNIVPWQLLREQLGIELQVAPINDAGEVILARYYELLENAPKIVAITHVSNAIGSINPIVDMVAAAKNVGAVTLVDGCQAVPHLALNMQQIGAKQCSFKSQSIRTYWNWRSLW